MCGRFLLTAVTYGHFYVEHTLGHHKDVCTDRDAATARYGETFWSFVPRVVKGEFLSAWRLEAERLHKKQLPFYHNEIPMYFGGSAVMCALLAFQFGLLAIPFFLIQSVFAIMLFESVNYLEHYGLERKQLPSGEHEPVQPQHSW
jgi:alkane 1-monooxygenase